MGTAAWSHRRLLALVLLIEGGWQRLDKRPDFIPHPAIGGQTFAFRLGIGCQARRIIETYMDGRCLTRKHGTMLVGIAADSHHVIKRGPLKLANSLRPLIGNIDARLGHDPNGIGVQAVGLNARRVRFDLIGFQVASPAFRHLTAAGVAGAEE